MLAALVLAGCGRDAPPPPVYKNVVLVVADALGSRHLPSYGYSRNTAPFVTRLAREGIQLQGYSASSWTRSSMATLLTGLYPQRHRTYGRNDALPPEAPYLPALLTERGVQSVAYVTNGNVGKDFGFDRGYAMFRTYSGQAKPSAALVRRKLGLRIPKLTPPFFLYLHLIDPHDPYFPQRAWDDTPPTSAEYVQPQEILNGSKPATEAHIRAMRNQHDGDIREMDAALEGMVADLAAAGLLEETLFIFTADHGEEFHEHAGVGHGRSLYDEVLAVPFILWNLQPPLRPRISPEPFDQVDFLPTVLAALDLPAPPGIDGVSQWAAIAAGETADERPVFSHLEIDGFRQMAIRSGGFKLVTSAAEPVRLLFNIRRDPGELEPLPADSARGRVLEDRLERTHHDLAARSFTAPQAEVSEETLKQLKALGYI